MATKQGLDFCRLVSIQVPRVLQSGNPHSLNLKFQNGPLIASAKWRNFTSGSKESCFPPNFTV